MLTNKTWWRAALTRAIRTVAQTLGSTLPVGAPVTVAMVRTFDISVVWAILAWLGTGLLAGLSSLLMSLSGLPEVDMAEAKEEKKEADPEIRIVRVDGDSADEMDYIQEGNIYFLNNEE